MFRQKKLFIDGSHENSGLARFINYDFRRANATEAQ